MPIIDRVAALTDEVTAWRRDLHAHPELLYDVHRTAGFVADQLRAFGCDEVVTGIGRTGVVGVVRGNRPGSRVIGMRADMDALPIEEQTNLPYRSKTPGLMHACGHDGHTAMLLGAAKHLAATRDFAGTAVFVFQPAEEGGAGGAAMVEDGLMTRFGIQEIYGMHNWPGHPVGTFAIRKGPVMAAADRFTITIEGKGGHAAQPHACIDTLLVGAQIVVALQSIVSRNANPLDSLVISTCTFKAGETFNVIPQYATLLGTVRTFRPEVQDLAERRIKEIATGVASSFGAVATVDYGRGYPATVNHEAEAEIAAKVANSVSTATTDIPPQMASEDFSFMLLERPGAFVFIGNGDTAVCHHPAYTFDDGAIPYGISFWAKLVEDRLAA